MSGYRQLLIHSGYSQDFSTSVYSHVKRATASLSSQFTEVPELLKVGFHKLHYLSDVYLRGFLGSSEVVLDHDNTCKKLLEKLKQMFSTDEVVFKGNKFDIIRFATEPARPLLVKTDIRPDVFINVRGITFLQFEVHSTKSRSNQYTVDEYKSTVKKLAIGLAEQLRCLRQADVNTTEIVGYYLPTGIFPDYPIEKVKCSWDEKNLCFIISCEVLPKQSDAEEDIKAVFAEQKAIFERVCDNPNQTPSLLLPLTTDFLREKFGANAKQLCSGESFVIECDNLIYKRPLSSSERDRLQYFVLKPRICPSKSIVPYAVELINRTPFFLLVRSMYQPLSKCSARRIFNNTANRKQWLNGVVEAIRELHDLGIAHLDIRLPNICYRNDLTAVLIDLDRSVDKVDFQTEHDFDRLRSKYSDSELYSIDVDVTNPDQIEDHIYKLDYKQLAIMLLDLLSNNIVYNSYNSEPNNLQGSHEFLCELYQGNFNEELYEHFLENPIVQDD